MNQHTMTGDEHDALVALTDWVRAGRPLYGKVYATMVQMAESMVDVIDEREESGAVADAAE